MTDLRRLRAACERRLDGLNVPSPFHLDTFVRTVAKKRGRPVFVHDLPFPASPEHPYGVVVRTDRDDHLFIEATTSGWHRDLIACHELAHLLCEHPIGLPTDLFTTVLPDLDPAVVRHMLARQIYTCAQEREAELLASLIIERSGRPAAHRDVAGGVLASRLSDVLADPRTVAGRA